MSIEETFTVIGATLHQVSVNANDGANQCDSNLCSWIDSDDGTASSSYAWAYLNAAESGVVSITHSLTPI